MLTQLTLLEFCIFDEVKKSAPTSCCTFTFVRKDNHVSSIRFCYRNGRWRRAQRSIGTLSVPCDSELAITLTWETTWTNDRPTKAPSCAEMVEQRPDEHGSRWWMVTAENAASLQSHTIPTSTYLWAGEWHPAATKLLNGHIDTVRIAASMVGMHFVSL